MTEQLETIDQFPAPYGKELTLQTVTYEGGMQLLRIRIKEGKRFTTLDLDANTAQLLVSQLTDWQQRVDS